MNLQLFIISLLSISTIHYYLFSMEIPKNKTLLIQDEVIKEHKVNLQMAQIKKIEKIEKKPETKPQLKKEVVKKIEKKEIKKPIIEKKIIKKEKSKEKTQKKETKKVEKIQKPQKVSEEIKTIKEVKKAPLKTIEDTQKIKKEQNSLKSQYLNALRAKIDENKHYPKISKRLNEQGISTISFRVLKNGTFINIKIHTSSGKKRLDKAALEAIISTNSFMPFNKKIKASYMDIIIPIEFKLQ
ncbi:energy transducer TonB [Arcobacter sp. YIC-464]|uniref:energy transducer TonB n=1 Tax=Arcobacter sp. YIC-464 TaxID=3376631 RepID=UPI003C1B0753